MMTTEEMEAFAAAHGLAALLDHLGLDGLGNEVERLRGTIRAVLDLRSTYDREALGRDVKLVGNLQSAGHA